MSNLNFLHSGGNKVTLSAPTSDPSSNPNFKLPQADGSSGQAIVTDGSGALSFATPAGTNTSNYKITTGSVINTGNAVSETVTGIPSDAVKVELLY